MKRENKITDISKHCHKLYLYIKTTSLYLLEALRAKFYYCHHSNHLLAKYLKLTEKPNPDVGVHITRQT